MSINSLNRVETGPPEAGVSIPEAAGGLALSLPHGVRYAELSQPQEAMAVRKRDRLVDLGGGGGDGPNNPSSRSEGKKSTRSGPWTDN